MNEAFHELASHAAEVLGWSHTFVLAVSVLVLWASTGQSILFSDTWQLVVNTRATIVTFLLVILVNNTQSVACIMR